MGSKKQPPSGARNRLGRPVQDAKEPISVLLTAKDIRHGAGAEPSERPAQTGHDTGEETDR